MGFLDDLELLSRHAPDDARNALRQMLGNMPISKALHGQGSDRSLEQALMDMPVGPDAEGAYGAAMQVGPLGMLGKLTKFEKAHKVAQKNAVEMLGLGPNNTAAERAKAMGFEDGWAHGSPNPNVQEMLPSKTGAEGPGSYATNYLPEASTYAMGDAATVYPLMVKKGNAFRAEGNPYDLLGAADDAELLAALRGRNLDAIVAKQPETSAWLIANGAQKFPPRDHYASMSPSNFRSRFAAFDPKRKDEADLLAAYFGLPLPQDNERARGY